MVPQDALAAQSAAAVVVSFPVANAVGEMIVTTAAIGIAGIGLYAAFAQPIAQRRLEMAIRVAIGASPTAVMSQ